MERLIVVAIANKVENKLTFKVANDSKAALRIVTKARNEGFITAVGAINYQYSREKAYAQLRESLRKKILEKIEVKI